METREINHQSITKKEMEGPNYGKYQNNVYYLLNKDG